MADERLQSNMQTTDQVAPDYDVETSTANEALSGARAIGETAALSAIEDLNGRLAPEFIRRPTREKLKVLKLKMNSRSW